MSVVQHARSKKAVIDGALVSTLTDPIVEQNPTTHTSWIIGARGGPERVPSQEVPLQVGALDVLRMLFVWRREDLRDAAALWRLAFGSAQKLTPQRWVPVLGYLRIPRICWFSYVLCGIRLWSRSASRFAAQFDELYIVCFYDAKCLALTRAFRAQDKPVTDVQHGLIAPSHAIYANQEYWRDGGDLAPTGFLVWDAPTKNFIEQVSLRHATIRDFDHSYYFSESRSVADSHANCILVTLQWGTSLPTEVLDVITTRSDLRWLLRMHPNDRTPSAKRADCARLAQLSNVEIVEASSPLHLDLSRSILHLTENSSVVIEAATVGVYSVFWDDRCMTAFETQVAKGLASHCPPAQVADCVRQFFADRQT